MFRTTLKNNIEIQQLLSDRSNVFLIKTETLCILIDTAKANQRQTLQTKLAQHSITKIDWLLLTHTHFDHCENASFIKRKYEAKIVASEKTISNSEAGLTPMPKGTNFLTRQISRFGNLLTNIKTYEPFEIDFPINNKQDLINEITLLPSAGHSEDSISIIVNRKICFVGDAMFGIFPRSIYPPFANAPQQLKTTWQKRYKTKCHTFLPSHGKPIKRIRVELALNTYL